MMDEPWDLERYLDLIKDNQIKIVQRLLRYYYKKLQIIMKFLDYLKKNMFPKNKNESAAKKKIVNYIDYKFKKILKYDQKILQQTQKLKSEALKKIFIEKSKSINEDDQQQSLQNRIYFLKNNR